MMERINFALSGMTCGHCVASVEKALKTLDGAVVETVGINTATVGFDPARTSRAALAEAIENAGYNVVSSRAA